MAYIHIYFLGGTSSSENVQFRPTVKATSRVIKKNSHKSERAKHYNKYNKIESTDIELILRVTELTANKND